VAAGCGDVCAALGSCHGGAASVLLPSVPSSITVWTPTERTRDSLVPLHSSTNALFAILQLSLSLSPCGLCTSFASPPGARLPLEAAGGGAPSIESFPRLRSNQIPSLSAREAVGDEEYAAQGPHGRKPSEERARAAAPGRCRPSEAQSVGCDAFSEGLPPKVIAALLPGAPLARLGGGEAGSALASQQGDPESLVAPPGGASLPDTLCDTAVWKL